MEIRELQAAAWALAVKKQWTKDWSQGGCYLMLEAAELIESLRGKGNSTPQEEAGDVMMALLTMLSWYGIDFETEVLPALERKIKNLNTPYKARA